MSMYDDLDPMFAPSADAALEKVAVRVHALRMRRRATIASALSTVVVVTALTSAAFASGRNDQPRVSVNESVTTTTTESTTTEPDRTTTTSVADATTTSVDPTPTTASGAPNNDGGAPDGAETIVVPDPTTTTRPPPDLHFAFDRDRLVIQSGKTATISYTVTNQGEGPGSFFEPGCPDDAVWVNALGWPESASQRVYCQSGVPVTIEPHESKTFSHTLVAGQYDGANDRVVPSAPGTTTYYAGNNQLPVTITAPAQLPFGSTFPAHVTVASGAAHTEIFTLTNRLPFAVSFTLSGPCMRPAGSTAQCGEVADGPFPGPWTTFVHVGANATVTMTMELSGTDDLLPPGPDNSPRPPGTYHFQGPGGNPLTLTVTP